MYDKPLYFSFVCVCWPIMLRVGDQASRTPIHPQFTYWPVSYFLLLPCLGYQCRPCLPETQWVMLVQSEVCFVLLLYTNVLVMWSFYFYACHHHSHHSFLTIVCRYPYSYSYLLLFKCCCYIQVYCYIQVHHVTCTLGLHSHVAPCITTEDGLKWVKSLVQMIESTLPQLLDGFTSINIPACLIQYHYHLLLMGCF